MAVGRLRTATRLLAWRQWRVLPAGPCNRSDSPCTHKTLPLTLGVECGVDGGVVQLLQRGIEGCEAVGGGHLGHTVQQACRAKRCEEGGAVGSKQQVDVIC